MIRSKAFTLVEALVTLALVALILPVAFQALAISTSLASSASNRLEAVAMAETKLAELVATNAWQTGSLEGDFTQTPSGEPIETTDDANDYRWTATLTDWTDATFQELAVTVYWTHRGQEQSTTLTTLVMQPEDQQ